MNPMPLLPSLAKIRRASYMTQSDLAASAGLARSTIAELELQDRPARFTTMKKLAMALGVELEQLLEPDDTPADD